MSLSNNVPNSNNVPKIRVTDWESTLFKSIGMACISKIISRVPDVTPSPVKGALLALTLPSLHYLTIVSILDEGLSEHIDSKKLPWPPKTKHDLFNRINVVAAAVPTINPDLLHEIRERRNKIAHEPDSVLSRPLTWEQLDQAITGVCQTIKELGLIGTVPRIDAFFERTPQLFPNELGPNGERIRHSFLIGAKLNDEVFISFTHDISYFPPTP